MRENKAKCSGKEQFDMAVKKPLKMRENEAKSSLRRRSWKELVDKAVTKPLKMRENEA